MYSNRFPRNRVSPLERLVSTIVLILVALLVSVMLTGCIGTTAPVVVTKYVLETPPDALLQDCDAVPPPAQETYVKSTAAEKEKSLHTTLHDNYTTIKLCNKDKKSLREWKETQQKIYEKKNNPGSK